MKINLETLCRPIAGIHSATIQGDSNFIDSLLSDAPLKRQFHGAPLLIAIRPERAPEAEYLIWATWFVRHEELTGDFLPLKLWRRDLGPEGPRSMLVLARAQGRWDILPLKDPRLPALLGERDPSGIPDGRVLMLADDPTVPPEPASEKLARGLQFFLSSIGEAASSTLLPERSIFIRSGRKTFDMSTESAMRIFFMARASENPVKGGQTPHICLSRDIHSYVTLKGSLIWGAWRGKGASACGFVTSTSSAAKGVRHQLGIRYQGKPLTVVQLAELLAPFINAKLQSGEPTVTTRSLSEDPALQRMLSRALKTMESSVARNPEILKSLDTPHRLLHSYAFDNAPTLADAARFPDPILLPGGYGNVRYANRLPGGFVSFSSVLGRQRDLALVARYSPSLAAMGTPLGLQAVSKAFQFDTSASSPSKPRRKKLFHRRTTNNRSGFVPFVPNYDENAMKGGVGEGEDGIEGQRSTIAQIFQAACGHASTTGKDLIAVYQIDRPSRLLTALLREVIGWAGMPWPLPEEMQAHLQGSSRLRLRLETRVSQEALGAWHTLASMEKLDIGWLRSAALTMQRTLRALLAIAALETEEQAANPRDARILLVHRHAREYIAPRSGEIVADPAENTVVRRTIRGANYSLRRKSAVWQSMLQKTLVPWGRRTAAVFAEIQMDICLERLEDTRRLLFAEAAMCHQISRIAYAATRRVASPRNLQPIGVTESNKWVRGVLRAAHRLWKGADTVALANTLMVAASGALANMRDEEKTWPQIRLGLQPLNEKNMPLGPMMCLDSAGVHEEYEDDGPERQEPSVDRGLTRAA